MVVFELGDFGGLLVEGVEECAQPGAVGYLEPQRAVAFPPGLALLGRERRDGLVHRTADGVDVVAEHGDAPRPEVRLAAPDGHAALAYARARARGLATRDMNISRLTTGRLTVHARAHARAVDNFPFFDVDNISQFQP